MFSIGRRELMKVGAAGVLGAALPTTLRANESAHPAKSVIWVHLSGGPSQLDMWDPKPQSPDVIRGEFGAIDTAIPGVQIGEHMPRLARMMNRWSLIRTLTHVEGNHLLATHVALTGRPTPVPRGGSDLDRVQSRSDFPNMASVLDYLQPRNDGVPSGVSLPNYFIEGPLTWPGQYAGFLGMKHDPWQINQDPNDPQFKVDALTLPAEVSPLRLVSRRELTSVLERENPMGGRAAGFQEQQSLAFSLLTSAQVTKAFDIHSESAETRDRYGRSKFGQSLLLARRLVEAGVPIIQAAMGIVQTWDTHVDNWGRLKTQLLPQLDQGLEALMTDLEASGRLKDTLVVVMGEFGRTPRISTLPGQTVPGRDHWPFVYSGLMAGAGVRGGQVLGQSDAQAAYPVSRSWTPADVLTTIYKALGVDEHAELLDPLGRPNRLLNGDVIDALYTGV
ncbi:MAG: DUF1501 domain-containing protein [Planctomycetota bacterium]|nr:MAG: DUF1501 domain-containing protein [Planctomycetota bacterium]